MLPKLIPSLPASLTTNRHFKVKKSPTDIAKETESALLALLQIKTEEPDVFDESDLGKKKKNINNEFLISKKKLLQMQKTHRN